MDKGDRREFLRRTVLGAAAVGAGVHLTRGQRATAQDTAPQGVRRRVLGRTGVEVSILGLGLGSQFVGPHKTDPDAAFAILERALTVHGVNYWDTASTYGDKLADGTRVNSEDLIGPAVEAFRDRIFLVSKSPARDYDGFLRSLETSLKRMRTDHLDIYHLHNLNPRRDTDLAKIENGAVRAARKAREEGTIRFFGITGHSSARLLAQAIEAWDPDAVLTTFPATRPDEGRYETELLPLATRRNMGVIAMKTHRGVKGPTPFKGSDLVRYAVSLDGVHTAIVGLDSTAHLDDNAAMATDFVPLTAEQRNAMSRQTRVAMGDWIVPWDRPGYRDGLA